MNIDSGYETIAYISEEKKNEPYSKYIMNYDLMFKSSNTINDVLMIGGAGYSYPRYYLTKYKDKKIWNYHYYLKKYKLIKLMNF
jgi:hypothetical protein